MVTVWAIPGSGARGEAEEHPPAAKPQLWPPPRCPDRRGHGRSWCSYPSVLMKPLVDPSAYREQMSPMCRKLDILSDMSS